MTNGIMANTESCSSDDFVWAKITFVYCSLLNNTVFTPMLSVRQLATAISHVRHSVEVFTFLTSDGEIDTSCWLFSIYKHSRHRLMPVILPAKVREYVFTGVGLCVCLCVCLSVCDHDN